MDVAKLAEAIKSIPEKKEDLRQAFVTLQTSFSSLATSASSHTFTLQDRVFQLPLQWKDLEDHISSIETPIVDLFNAARQKAATIDTTPITTDDDDDDRNYYSTLKSACRNMDAKGIRSFLSYNRNNNSSSLLSAIGLALRSAPDPALLVLNAMEGFHPPSTHKKTKKARKRELLTACKTCIYLLEIFHPISLEIGIKPAVRERALSLAVEWRAEIAAGNDESLGAAPRVLGFLRLVAAYGLVPEFGTDEIMELLCNCVSRKCMTVDLIESLGLADKVYDLVRKLNSKGRQLIAVKIVYSFNVVDKFPPVTLLEAFITVSKQRADELREKGNYSVQAQNAAISKEIGAIKMVLKAIEEYKLEREFPRENLLKRFAQLCKKRAEVSVASSNSKTQRKQQPSKRPRPSPATSVPATSAPVISANSYHEPIQRHLQCGWAESAPCMGISGPRGLAATGFVCNHGVPSLYGALSATGSVYNHGGGPRISCIARDQGATRKPPRSYYSSEYLAG